MDALRRRDQPNEEAASQQSRGATSGAGKKQLLSAGLSSVLAIVEQLVVAASNFLLNVLFARWGTAEDYGAYSFTQAAFLMFAVLYNATLTEPMLVFSHARYGAARRPYYETVLKLQWLLAGVCAVVLLVAALTIRGESRAVSDALFGFIVAGPAILIFGLVRRIAYSEGRPGIAAAAAMLYLVISIAAAFGLNALHAFNAFTVLSTTAVASVPCVAFLWITLTKVLPATTSAVPVRQVAGAHWQYGRWAVLSGCASWLPANIGALILPVWGGLASVAAYRALMNLTQPAWHLSVALGAIALPALARRVTTRGYWRDVRFLVLGFSGMGATYAIATAVFGPAVVRAVYHGKFGGYGLTLVLLGLSATPLLTSSAATAALRATAAPQLVFVATALGGLVALGVALLAVPSFGIVGAAMASLASYTITCVILLYQAVRAAKRGEAARAVEKSIPPGEQVFVR